MRANQNVACGLAGELVGAVAGANGDRQRVQLRQLHEFSRLFGVGQQLVMGHDRVGAVAVFLVALHGFQAAQATQLTFNRHAGGVGHLHDLAGDFHVVVEAGNGFAIGL
jgi:hypothetical protein